MIKFDLIYCNLICFEVKTKLDLTSTGIVDNAHIYLVLYVQIFCLIIQNILSTLFCLPINHVCLIIQTIWSQNSKLFVLIIQNMLLKPASKLMTLLMTPIMYVFWFVVLPDSCLDTLVVLFVGIGENSAHSILTLSRQCHST